jgi:putative thioredoxin
VAAPTGAPLGALRGAVDLAPLVARSAQPSAAPAQLPPSTPRAAGEAGSGPDVVFDAGDAEFASVVELSRTVPVIVALVAEWSTPSRELLPALASAVEALNGRMALAVVDTDASPQLAAAFQAQSVPTVAAVLAGRPLSLFAGAATAEQLGPLLEQVLELAAQNGVTGSLGEAPEAAAEPEPEPPLPPHHAEAYEAIDHQDYAEAARRFRLAIAQNPRDTAAVAALAQVELLERLGEVDPAAARTAAAADPEDVAAQLTVADLDISGGHVDDAFARLLDVVARTAGDERTAARERLLAYFEIVGVDDPRVMTARRRLTTLLY